LFGEDLNQLRAESESRSHRRLAAGSPPRRQFIRPEEDERRGSPSGITTNARRLFSRLPANVRTYIVNGRGNDRARGSDRILKRSNSVARKRLLGRSFRCRIAGRARVVRTKSGTSRHRIYPAAGHCRTIRYFFAPLFPHPVLLVPFRTTSLKAVILCRVRNRKKRTEEPIT